MTKNWIMRINGWITICAFVLMGCGGCQEKNLPPPQLTDQEVREGLINMHRMELELESKRIDQWIADKGWTMTESHTGLRYETQNVDSLNTINSGDFIQCEYSIRLLDSTLCYSSELDGPLQFEVGMADVVTGMHEAAQLLSKGASGKFVLPARLGYGLSGDQEKIPGSVALWLEMTVKDVAK